MPLLFTFFSRLFEFCVCVCVCVCVCCPRWVSNALRWARSLRPSMSDGRHRRVACFCFMYVRMYTYICIAVVKILCRTYIYICISKVAADVRSASAGVVQGGGASYMVKDYFLLLDRQLRNERASGPSAAFASVSHLVPLCRRRLPSSFLCCLFLSFFFASSRPVVFFLFLLFCCGRLVLIILLLSMHLLIAVSDSLLARYWINW